MLLGEFGHRGHVGGAAVEVNGHESFCPRCKGGFGGANGQGKRVRVDIDQHRLRADEQHRLRRGVKRQRRDDHLVAGADPERPQRQDQGVGPRTDPDRVRGGRVGGELGLETRDPFTQDELTAAERLQNSGLEPFLHGLGHRNVEKPDHAPPSPRRLEAAMTVFCMSIATVIGPTPPGTGVR